MESKLFFDNEFTDYVSLLKSDLKSQFFISNPCDLIDAVMKKTEIAFNMYLREGVVSEEKKLNQIDYDIIFALMENYKNCFLMKNSLSCQLMELATQQDMRKQQFSKEIEQRDAIYQLNTIITNHLSNLNNQKG